MTETKFTPGPWSFRQNHSGSLDFFGEGGHRLILGNTFLINQDANAHLIAAAPELFEKLAKIRGWINVDAEGPWGKRFYAEVDALLAKARGEA